MWPIGLIRSGFMNQTICAVWSGDKSRFLSLCYRTAAPVCWLAVASNACHVRKTPADQLVLHWQWRRFYCWNASATERRGSTSRLPGLLRRGDAGGSSWPSAIRVAFDTRTEAPAGAPCWALSPAFAQYSRWACAGKSSTAGATRILRRRLERLLLDAPSAILFARRVAERGELRRPLGDVDVAGRAPAIVGRPAARCRSDAGLAAGVVDGLAQAQTIVVRRRGGRRRYGARRPGTVIGGMRLDVRARPYRRPRSTRAPCRPAPRRRWRRR